MVRLRSFYIQLIEKGPSNFWGWVVFVGLWPFSLLYRIVMRARAQAYALGINSVYRSRVPVVSVGNITVGGTGKTPVVDVLVKYLLSRNRKVAVVSRGYKGSFQADWCRVNVYAGSETDPAETGDEPFLLAVKNPDASVYVARKRRHGVAAAEADGADCVLLDDAFQHLAVARDLDIVLLDARKPFGNGNLVPAGCLREPSSALKRAGLIVQTHSDNANTGLIAGVEVVNCSHQFASHLLSLEGEQASWDQVLGSRCLAFAGIAHPEDFFQKLRVAGCDLLETLPLADHQEYSEEVVQTINQAGQEVDVFLTTEKDAVKLKGYGLKKPCFTVPLELEFSNFEKLAARLDAVLGDSDE